ncbi:MAG: restriction endonuclease subunit S [Lacticaseibacillus paracasei]
MAEFDCLYSEVLLTRNAWEKRKLGEIAGIFDGTHQTPNYQSSGIMFLSVENIQTLKSNKFISLEDFQKDFKVSPRTGDILMTRIGNIGTTNVVKSTRPIAYYVSLALIRPNDAIDVYYLNYAINGLSFQRELRRRTLSVAFPQKINKQEIGKSIVDLPSPSEQIQIGNLFVLLDNLIAATQHKIDALEQAKKALLQRLFDQSWRFKGYSDPWEKRKLREITEINPKGKIPEVFRYVDLESVKNSSIISSKIETKQTAPSRAQRTAEIGDVFYQTVRPYQKNNVIFLLHSSMPYVFSTGYAQLRSNMNSFFILYLVQTDGFVNDVLNRATGTSYPAINPTHLATIIVCFPKIVSEQNRIGQVLEHLDNLITATQSRLSSLELLKKALLQDLFI